jgi:hypothetical protein
MRLPKTAVIATSFILPLFTVGLLIVTQPATHAKPQQHISLKPATSTSQVKGDSTVQITTPSTTTQAGPTTYATAASGQPKPLTQTPTPSATNTTPSTSIVAQAQPSNNNQLGNEQTVELHIGGYPPAIGAALTGFENPTHVPCGGQQYPQNADCNYNLYQWVTTKYCIYTYADNHTQTQPYQYQAYGDIYANADGSLNPSGINMAVTSSPTYNCDVSSAPKSVFEQSYTY